MSAKTNPRRLPATQADVKAAYRRGRDDGAAFGMTIAIWAVVKNLEAHDVSREDVMALGPLVEDVCRSIIDGRVSYRDIEKQLEDEYGITVSLEGGKP